MLFALIAGSKSMLLRGQIVSCARALKIWRSPHLRRISKIFKGIFSFNFSLNFLHTFFKILAPCHLFNERREPLSACQRHINRN